jgi:hypothetical protein
VIEPALPPETTLAVAAVDPDRVHVHVAVCVHMIRRLALAG